MAAVSRSSKVRLLGGQASGKSAVCAWPARTMTGREVVELRFCFGLKPDVTALHFDGVLHGLAAMLLSKLVGLLLNKGSKAIEVAGDSFAGFLLGVSQSVIELLHLVALRFSIGAENTERSLRTCLRRSRRCSSTTDSVNRMMLQFIFVAWAHALYRQKGILRPAVPLFTNTSLFAPEVAIDRVTLCHLVVAKALGEGQLSTVAELAQHTEDLPFNIRGRFFCGIAEVHLIFNLEATQLRLKHRQFFVDSHQRSPPNSLGCSTWTA